MFTSIFTFFCFGSKWEILLLSNILGTSFALNYLRGIFVQTCQSCHNPASINFGLCDTSPVDMNNFSMISLSPTFYNYQIFSHYQ